MLSLVSMRGVISRRLPHALLIASMVLAGVGCTSSSAANGPNVSSTSVSRRPSTPATLEIEFPAPNVVTGPSVSVVMRLNHAQLVPPTQVGGAIFPDRGHIHVLVDGQLVAMPLQLTEPLPTLSPGMHTVQAEFVASDHLPFENRVVAAVTFRVR